MQPSEILKQQFLQIVSNQLRLKKPPEVAQTFERLKQEGYPDADARALIAQCVAVEIFRTMKYNEAFNNERYVQNLYRLPDFPSEE